MSETRLKDARILIVDDEPANVRLIERILRPVGYTKVRSTHDSREVLNLFFAFKPDLILLDMHMPHLDGHGVLQQLKPHIPAGEYFPILVLTADALPATKEKALSMGAKDFLTKPFHAFEVVLRIHNLLETRFLYLALHTQNRTLDAKVVERTYQLEQAQYEMLDRLARASESRDDNTGQHTLRVGMITAAIARAAGYSNEESALIGRAASLHDLGKIGIPDSILLKPGSLTTKEFDFMKTHTTLGASILSGSQFPLIQLAEGIALNHHEKWDGTGYMGLSGEEIPRHVRIVTIADVFDVLTHWRTYKEAWSQEKAMAEIESQSGRAFDPELVRLFRDTIWQQDLAELKSALNPEVALAAEQVLVRG